MQLRALLQNGVVRGSEEGHKEMNHFNSNQSKRALNDANGGGDRRQARGVDEKGHKVVQSLVESNGDVAHATSQVLAVNVNGR